MIGHSTEVTHTSMEDEIMNSTPEITNDPLLFDKLLEPIAASLQQLDQEPLSRAAKKLRFRLFVRVLLFRLFAQIQSLGLLVLDLKTTLAARDLGLPVLGLATIHDAFVRYPLAWFLQLTQALLADGVLLMIPELQVFGPLWCVDSSWWPLVHQLGWLQAQGFKGVRLHLGLSLNLLCPAAFVLSYDKSPTSTERPSLLALVVAGVTYITDRGYVSLPLYRELMERGAFFLIRERHNLRYRVLSELELTLEHLAGLAALSACRDEIIQLTRDAGGTVLRLVSFRCGGHYFVLATNRFDLTTAQLIRLYSWRWQVELLFRAWKHTLGALHLINLSERGIAIQFQVLLLASLLWVRLQQQVAQQAAASGVPAAAPQVVSPSPFPRTVTARLSTVFRVAWRLLKPAWRVLTNCLAQPFSVYLTAWAELNL